VPTDSALPVDTFVLKGSRLAKRLRAEIVATQQHLRDSGGTLPRLATVLVGEDPAAIAYRSSIERTFGRVELDQARVELPVSITPDAFVDQLRELNRDPAITAILVLMPLPGHLDPHLVLENLSPLKDVDGITPTNAGRLHLGLPSLRPSTPAGGIALLDHYGVTLDGARVTVVGRSNVVGRPLATLLTHRNATVTLCHSHTRTLGEETLRAEIVCVAAGHAGLITRDMVSPGAVVLDFGVNVAEDGSLVGDADFEALQGVAGAITPVPGGTGPVTALTLARNTLAAGFATLGGNLDHVEYTLPEGLQNEVDQAVSQS
jgi:methylenetetrahydrofolate dehydrogenase (NADP+)/methenyltetrahydrofolate cyclohydrolase